LFVVGVFVLIWRTYRILRGSRINTSDAMSLALLTGIVSYAFILTILQVTSYTSIGRQLNTMYPIVLAFVLSWMAGFVRRES
ncbi:MAG: hypothetical protein EBT18_11975, partial [Gammaproteobacteria bacterium]|nr:hypothetical protein [Gammaproteobacteria bacterium]